MFFATSSTRPVKLLQAQLSVAANLRRFVISSTRNSFPSQRPSPSALASTPSRHFTSRKAPSSLQLLRTESPSHSLPRQPTNPRVFLLSHSQSRHWGRQLHTVSRAKTSTFSKSATRLPAPKEASATWWLSILLVLLTGTAATYTFNQKDSPNSGEKPRFGGNTKEGTDAASLSTAGLSLEMAAEFSPGRPGNLTPEQEVKLRELWAATLQVFGALDDAAAKDVVANGLDDSASGTDKKKKNRLSIFSRKHKNSDAASTKSDDSSPSAEADDDKYGQTKQFKETLAQQSPESLRATFWSMVKHDHPDALLLRFLRARKWDVEKALHMMISTMNWRATEMHVDDDVMKEGEGGALAASNSDDKTKKKFGEDFMAQMRMGKSFVHGCDKLGRPICCIRVRLHKQGEQSEESMERYTVFVIETTRLMLNPPVDTACVLFDMTGFSMANMDYSPVKFMIKCFEANYPESLGIVLVHNAPWIFQGIWKIIRGWLDPVVASKVSFTNNAKDLEEHIPNSQILQSLGGGENWSYEYVEPAANENEAMKDTATRDKMLVEREKIVNDYEKATVQWIQSPEAGNVAQIKSQREETAKRLKEDYWKLDPYVRARSLYDRQWMIKPGGGIDFYPKTAPAPAANGTKPVEMSADDID